MILPSRIVRFLAGLAWIAAICWLMAQPASAQNVKEKEKLLRSKQKLEEEIRRTTGLLEKTRNNKNTSLQRIQMLSRQIRTREALIRAINQELEGIEASIALDSARIGELSGRLGSLRSEYADMLRYAQRVLNGNNRLMFIFSASDFNQAWVRLKYCQQYAGQLRRQAGLIEDTRRDIDSHRAQLQTARGEKLGLVQSKLSEKDKMDREKKEKDKAVKELTAQEKKLLAEIRSKQQSARQMEAAIEKLIAEEVRLSAERTRSRETGTVKPGGTPSGAGRKEEDFARRDRELSASFSANRGNLPWPCEQGFVSGDFGEHAHPVFKQVMLKNNGINIMTDPGSPVRAVFGGKVSKVISLPAYHTVVIIRHGEYLTVYSNLEGVSLREGQEVSARQTIGRVAAAAGGQKSELHFELWHGKVKQDPEIWLADK